MSASVYMTNAGNTIADQAWDKIILGARPLKTNTVHGSIGPQIVLDDGVKLNNKDLSCSISFKAATFDSVSTAEALAAHLEEAVADAGININVGVSDEEQKGHFTPSQPSLLKAAL